ncbi:MAG: hypothetical protein A3I92_00845 [Candidatus Yanofskybacteria bacterium RIFCSPLOWO2_02_FULL_43_10b]|uniref:Uncharacterized protein n=1 Tax=Candidatus Yanofskybacteria bacterium RIFCSPLOWO2_02_FULL_43_10b TaxID=1802704 RepID=A0A1F8H7C3_9BACT|nr:MAG: hypothetical protein A3I92_00845 [Candidatus Yanofskybacteria bacterium RIFCSPLOWO2_02_FULL_43_10b]
MRFPRDGFADTHFFQAKFLAIGPDSYQKTAEKQFFGIKNRPYGRLIHIQGSTLYVDNFRLRQR